MPEEQNQNSPVQPVMAHNNPQPAVAQTAPTMQPPAQNADTHVPFLEKASQTLWIGIVLFVIDVILSFVDASKMGALQQSVVLIVSLIVFTLIFWGMSRATKIKNPTLSSALFVVNGGLLISYLAILGAVGSFSFISFIITIILFKYAYKTNWGRSIWLTIVFGVISAVVLVIVTQGLMSLGIASPQFPAV